MSVAKGLRNWVVLLWGLVMSKNSSTRPVIVWLDDDLSPGLGKLLLKDTIESQDLIDAHLFHDTDRAIEFTIENAARVFLFIQDSSRWESNILSNWRSLRPIQGLPLDRTLAGLFYTYVIDAFAPQAGAIFAGYGFGSDELNYVAQWSRRDDRIAVADKWALLTPGKSREEEDPNGILAIAKNHLIRWSSVNANKAPDHDFKVLEKVAEEMAVLCSIRPSRLHAVSPRQFEELVATLFKNHGFDVELTATTRDGGYDIALVDHSTLKDGPILVECKHFAPGRPVGVGIVRALYGVKMLRGASKAILATRSYVSQYAKQEFARVIPWELEMIELNRILDMCKASVPKILWRRVVGDGSSRT
jgi:hypothetical protein